PTFADGVVYAPSEKFTALRPGQGNEQPAVLWQSLKLRPGYSSPVVHRGLVYVVNGGGVVACADAATGAVLWTQRLEAGMHAASPLLADGKLYVTSESGTTTILQTGKEGAVLGINPIDDTILASPVAADGAIFLRSDKALYFIDGKK